MVRAWPLDSVVSLDGVVGTGGVELDHPPGTVELRVERRGFVTLSRPLDLADGGAVVEQVNLVGEPIGVDVVTHPAGADVTVHVGDLAATGVSPFHAEVPAGDVVVDVAMTGMTPERHARFADAGTSFDVWLDPAGAWLDLLRVFPTGKLPKAVAFTPDGKELWVTALDGPPSVIVHDAETGARLADVDLSPHGAVEIAFAEGGKFAYVTQMETYKVFEIDTATRAVTRSVAKVGKYPKIVITSPDESKLYVSNWHSDDVTEIDRATMTVTRRFPTVHTPRGLWATPDGRSLYVAGFGSGELARIDLATGRSATFSSVGANLRHIVSDGASLFVSDMGAARVRAYDLATGATRTLCKTDPNPNTEAISPDGRLVFVSSRGPNGSGGYLTSSSVPGSVTVCDAATGDVVDHVIAGSQPTALAISVDGSRLVVSDFRDDQLRLYRVPAYERADAVMAAP